MITRIGYQKSTSMPSARAQFLAVLLLAVQQLATGAVSSAFTIYSPFALISNDQQTAAQLHGVLERRFRNMVVFESLALARSAAKNDGPEVALLITVSRDRTNVDAYGTSLPSCHYMVTAQLLRLPAATPVLSRSSEGRGSDCAAALAESIDELADDLVKSIEQYRRSGTTREKRFFRLELESSLGSVEYADLRKQLLEIPGIRTVVQEADGRVLKLEIYREPRTLAREIDRLHSVRIARLRATSAALDFTDSARGLRPRPQPTEHQEPRERRPSIEVAPPRSAALSAPPGTGRKWALVVGISRFRDQKVPTLSYADRDARSFADLLIDPDVGRFSANDVTVLLNQEATTRRLKVELDHLARMTRTEDLFLFFISSHAVPGQYDVAGDPYLLTHDTEKHNLYATGFPMRELVDALNNRIRAQTVVGFLDACHTGQVLQRSDLNLTGMKNLAYERAGSPKLSWQKEWDTLSRSRAADESKRIVFVTSSDGDQPSWESDRLRHGFFTYYLMNSLKSTRGEVAVGPIFDRLKQQVKQAVRSEKRALQEPRMFFSKDTDIFIGRPAQ